MSGSSGVVRKVYDTGPGAITSNDNYDGSSAPTTAWASGILTPANNGLLWLTSLAQGVTDNDRVGFSIACESLDLTLIINPDTGAGAVGNQVLRWLIFADNECDGAFPTAAEVLGNATGTDTTIATGLVTSHLQPGYFGRFHILMDEYWQWNMGTTGGVIANNDKPFCHRRHFDLKGHRVLWDMSDASAIANARKGHIFMMAFYQSTTTNTGGLPVLVSTNPPSIQFMTRLRYKDA